MARAAVDILHRAGGGGPRTSQSAGQLFRFQSRCLCKTADGACPGALEN